MKQNKFSARNRISSFMNALNGLKTVILGEHNAWIQLAVALCVIIAGVIFKITTAEWIAVVFVIGLVISLEIINTSIEKLADFVSQEKQEAIKKVKDISAAGVLTGAITALAIGLIIFLPKIVRLLTFGNQQLTK
jgi:undecaprenol kinase/diacylglycerol kinase (ATP)